MGNDVVTISYTNWRGETGVRRIIPRRIYHGTHKPYHIEPCWLLEAYDLGKEEVRTFKMLDIHSWTEESAIPDDTDVKE